MMKSSSLRLAGAALLVAWAASGAASASPVVYTLRTVADGKLGNLVFAEALVTFRMESDTSDVRTATSLSPFGGVLYTNSVGLAQVSVSVNGVTQVATFEPGEVYVRYDTGLGVAGFGSAISPSYPIALDCSPIAYPAAATYTVDCLQDDSNNAGTLYALQNPGSGWSPDLLALPRSLATDTVLSGVAHTCASIYTLDASGNLLVCSAPAARGLRTDRGGFYLQDQVGGASAGVGPFLWSGWTLANVGVLQVETTRGVHHRRRE